MNGGKKNPKVTPNWLPNTPSVVARPTSFLPNQTAESREGRLMMNNWESARTDWPIMISQNLVGSILKHLMKEPKKVPNEPKRTVNLRPFLINIQEAGKIPGI